MKLALIFLMSALVVTTHQYFRDHPREMSWLSPYYSPAHLDLNNQQFFVIYGSRPFHPAIYSSKNENFNRDFMVLPDDNSGHLVNEEFPDTQSRVKGFSLNRLSPDSNEQQASAGRFLFNLFSSTGTYTNAFLKTATFTSTLSLSLTSIVNCVPSNQVSNGAAATTCSRKRRRNVEHVHLLQDDRFSIIPSETLKLMPTATAYEERLQQLSSSKNDASDDDEIIMPTSLSSSFTSRGKRFLFANKNQFVVSTTVTSYALVNTTVTVTRNLLNPAPAAGVQCVGVAAAAVPQCAACLPSGYIVCPASG